MLRDLKASRRNSGKRMRSDGNDENLDPLDSSVAHLEPDPSRPPLNTIQDPSDGAPAAVSARKKMERTPSKNNHFKGLDAMLRTPEKTLALGRNRFGWAAKNDASGDNCDEVGHGTGHLPPLARGGSFGAGTGFGFITPRLHRNGGKASSVHSDCSSTQSTPTKSVNKPPNPGLFGSRPSSAMGARTANFAAATRGIPISSLPPSVVNSVEVPHFELREDPSFWMDHNVQVVIRVRPLNSMERTLQGYSRCLKQESAQSISWIGQPETRFTFDHVACETINQETLFRVAGLPMVENCMSGYNSCMFAYGQTGSGKTYTMLGEIDDLEARPSTDRGMTPRIFEFLFARIRAEEESRHDEKLKYHCKCSFLEIYNEQITDLLDPSSSNLLLREDIQKGVYVENLTEFAVENVNDILKLLVQGAANRKVAATNMNRESSRSHSVFTCVIESRWEKDSLTNLRFARLNLVDLAGSERQKTSGAEGERLKEAASINKSLSTLGHVIMVLVDVANGKQRHVPYRDSRLTFLLQDSLGGNSKTMIIANVSSSICCASETLSTLKFAQRAKLIQNNAFVNEDASGDVIALQHQIRLLKEELSMFKRQNVSRSLSFRTAIFQDSDGEGCDASSTEKLPKVAQGKDDDLHEYESMNNIRVSNKQLKSLEATLAGALRREKMADMTIKQLEAEIEQLNRLVRQREEDTRCKKMMLKFREDKIQRMEALVDGLVPKETYLLDENNSLAEEVHSLIAKADRNPEVTRFALENIRLLDQLRRFQDFYEEGEREVLLAEVSELRNQLLQFIDRKSEVDKNLALNVGTQEDVHVTSANPLRANDTLQIQLMKTCQELEDCRKNLKYCLGINEKLAREVDDLRSELKNMKAVCNNQNVDAGLQDMDLCSEFSPADNKRQAKLTESTHDATVKHAEETLNLQLELDILKAILGEERLCRGDVEERALLMSKELELAEENFLHISKNHEDMENALKDANALIDALESQQILSINEMDELRENYQIQIDLLRKRDMEISTLKKQLGVHFGSEERESCSRQDSEKLQFKHPENDSPLQMKLQRMQASLDKARVLNMRYQNDCEALTSHEQEMDEVRRQVEAETAEVIVCLQEELNTLQQQVYDSNKSELESRESMMEMEAELKMVQGRLFKASQDNKHLSEQLREKDEEIRSLTKEWDGLSYDIAEALTDGNMALEDAGEQVCSISGSLNQRHWVGEQVSRMIRTISEKDTMIDELNRCLEDAQTIRCDMEWKLRSLRGATLAITEEQQKEMNDKEREILHLRTQLSEKMSIIFELESNIKHFENQIKKAELRATVAFFTVKRMSEINTVYIEELENKELQLNELMVVNLQRDAVLENQISFSANSEEQIQSLKSRLDESEKNSAEIYAKLSEEQGRSLALENQLEKVKEDFAASRYAEDLLKTEEKLNEFKLEVSTLHSCMNDYIEQEGKQVKEPNSKNHAVGTADSDSEDRIDDKSTKHISREELYDNRDVGNDCIDNSVNENRNSSCGFMAKLYPSNIEELRTSKDVCDRETVVLLLRKEIESALKSLKGVQAQMSKLLQEKEESKHSEIQNRKDIEDLTAQVLQMEMEMINKEKQLELKLLEVDLKMQSVEGKAKDTVRCLKEAKMDFVHEVSDAKELAAQKAFEASVLLAQFDEAQETIREADAMINTLMAASETAKHEVQRYVKIENALICERDNLASEVWGLHSSLDVAKKDNEALEKKFQSNMAELESFIMSLESLFRQVQATFTEESNSISYDISCLKSQLHQSADSTRKWLEDIWSEIIRKGCALSVLHLCHMGIFMETVTGLNSENRFLYSGLYDSENVIVGLREQNAIVKKELEMCSILKGKLLVDINNSFSRVTRKEEEAGELKGKISSLDEKVIELQLQEESMLARSNAMADELAVLMNELEVNNGNALNDIFSKDFEILIYSLELKQKITELKQNAFYIGCLEREMDASSSLIDKLMGEIVLSTIEGELGKQILRDMEVEITFLKQESSETHARLDASSRDFQSLLLKLKQSSENESEMEKRIMNLEEDCHQNTLKESELKNQIRRKQTCIEEKTREMKNLEQSNDSLYSAISKLEQELELRNADITEFQCCNSNVSRDLEFERSEIVNLRSTLNALQDENDKLVSKILILKTEHSGVIEDLHEKRIELESCIRSMQTELGMKTTELDEVRCSHSVISTELNLKIQDSEIQNSNINSLKMENERLRDELLLLNQKMDEAHSLFTVNYKKCTDSFESVAKVVSRVSQIFHNQGFTVIETMLLEYCEYKEKVSWFIKVLESLESFTQELLSENSSLLSELTRKDELCRGLLFDLSLLQESASIAKDQKDELEEMTVTIQSLEDELALKSRELGDSVSQCQMLEAQLLEKCNILATLELEHANKQELVKLVSGENLEMKNHMKKILVIKKSIETELTEKTNLIESLESEILEMRTFLEQHSLVMDGSQNHASKLIEEKDHINFEISVLKEQLQMAHALAEENEAIATEAQQIAESRKAYAEDKEEEVRLLEKSIEELECTINVLQNKVEIVKDEAERQRLQREELEMELHAMKHQLIEVKACNIQDDAEGGNIILSRHIGEQEIELKEAREKIQILQKNVADKNAEISQYQSHIFELNMHAEAQAQQNMQKIKELEAMVNQVRNEPSSSNSTNLTAARCEKNAAKSRGSGSPFKCIGLGLTQQINSEKDEELAAGKLHIKELEALAATQQKEIFSLNSRLAASESMTHDVIRDLLGVKLDITNYASLVDNQQVQKIMESPCFRSEEPQVKEKEVDKLKKQLNEFIGERQSWLDELNRRHTEMVATKIALEKLRQRDQFLTAENEMLKADNVRHKKMIMQLEDEVKQQCGQQNLQHRIHHHAKIKEENNMLKVQKQDLAAKLERSEEILSRVRQELAHYRSSCGKNPYIDVDEEQRLREQLQESEKERIHLAQKLLSLCTCILKVAGITEPLPDINPSAAEAALHQLKDHINSLENELQDLKFKTRVSDEKLRLFELRQRSLPLRFKENDDFLR